MVSFLGWKAWLAAGTVAYVVAVAGFGMNPMTPLDYVLSVGRVPLRPPLALRPGERHVVVLQHGIVRSAASLWRLERTLRAHGYDVLNPSYPSTSATIEEHAERLAGAVADHLRARGDAPAISFVGHSMGGLVIRSYLSRQDAVTPAACVFLGTPHRGAMLADVRCDTLLFRAALGDRAGPQLRPAAPIYGSLAPLPCPAGNVVGGLRDGAGFSAVIPGDDDGTVAVGEAHLPEEADAVTLPAGHTYLPVSPEVHVQVLHFLRHHRFER
jgi:pimeloyl-ACP methyl ester carboxylesterase